MNRILLATGNENKFKEIKEEFSEIGIDILFPENENVTLQRPESGKTYLENARIKAEEGYEKSDLPALADDSGLEVDALDGAPGIYSDRWAGEDASSGEQNNHLLEKLEGVSQEDRTARFVCEMVLVDDSGQRFATRGVCEGRIAFEPRGEQGFGYDPIFEVKQADYKTFGELPPRTKNWISHRALALNKMISLIREDLVQQS
ncbi:MAG: RdgB/HAM1 family non-canonical purine NTP pyrophosphatase [bacterium]